MSRPCVSCWEIDPRAARVPCRRCSDTAVDDAVLTLLTGLHRPARRDWPVAVVLLLCLVGGLLFLALLTGPAANAMCDLRDNALRYCPTTSTTHPSIQEPR